MNWQGCAPARLWRPDAARNTRFPWPPPRACARSTVANHPVQPDCRPRIASMPLDASDQVAPARDRDADAREHSDIVYPSAIPFVIVHLACAAAIWTGITWQAVVIGIVLYWVRIFAIG